MACERGWPQVPPGADLATRWAPLGGLLLPVGFIVLHRRIGIRVRASLAAVPAPLAPASAVGPAGAEPCRCGARPGVLLVMKQS